ncbi:AraC family transcriptional regulator [Aquimarina sp. 2201CG5-10]|uniref:helix-turn-helix domain-containing protein n=1 Tax=Aquimarina callyspongiae TaxID=3098150 RepID=UPI002AB5C091|nr:AraC family transcriptional regulator [Aquimarina sp. 2201CG5-10]MDY8135909.1 AraC family transcriptional regulator [Aquimarina sp. 2201CG5-10]
MDKFSVLGIITLIIVFIALLLAVFLFTVKTKNKIGNLLMGVYFVVFAVHISVFFYAKYISLPSVIEMLRDQIMFLSSPLLYLYVISAIYSDFKIQKKHLVHLLPFVVEILIFVPGFYLVSDSERQVFVENFHSNIEVRLSSIYGSLVTIFYIILTFIELGRYKRLLLENYSNKTNFNYKWLYQLTVILAAIFVFSTSKQVYKFFGTDIEVLNIMRIVLTLGLLFFLTWIIMKSLYHPELFRSIDTKHLLAEKLLNQDNLEIQNKKEDKFSEQIEVLKKYMETNESYLDSSLTIHKLANQMNIPFRDLSILINHHLGQHFFDFINEYRIKKAIHLLDNPANKKLTILEILYDVGFNSKSPFNTAFKKHTGLTPTEYRKKH